MSLEFAKALTGASQGACKSQLFPPGSEQSAYEHAVTVYIMPMSIS